MHYYFAPMEGLTDSIYRKLHHKYFGGVDRYFMPFLSPTVHRSLTAREERELPYADTTDFLAVPQLLTKVSADFLWAAQQCKDRGYEEVNLNLGCPSGTVVAKGKGSGMLRDLCALERFLDGQTQENRVIFLRRYWFADSIQQIARRVGLRENTVSVRLNRLRRDLREYLHREGLL